MVTNHYSTQSKYLKMNPGCPNHFLIQNALNNQTEMNPEYKLQYQAFFYGKLPLLGTLVNNIFLTR